jgi:hypothetical protein
VLDGILPHLDQLDTCFDDTHAVANAGLPLAATLAERLGIEQTADALIDLGERPDAHRPGRTLLTLVHSMLAGGCIDDADVLRCGATSRVLGHRVMAPSTLGAFLGSFTFGHARQLDRLAEQVLARAWAAGAGPGDGPMTIDLDSTVCEVHGHAQQGAAYGSTRTLGYHPLLASRAESGEVLHARQRTGRANTARGTARFVDELAARVRRAGASGELTMRADSGFWSAKTTRACRRHRRAGMGRHPRPRRWRRPGRRDPLPGRPADRAPHPPDRRPGRAVPHLALPRLRHQPSRHDGRAGPRSAPPRRRGAVHPGPQGRRRAAAPPVGQVQRQRRLAGDRHPGAQPAALGRRHRAGRPRGAGGGQDAAPDPTGLPGRITHSARRWTLHLPAGWPWAAWFALALARLRCVATPPDPRWR